MEKGTQVRVLNFNMDGTAKTDVGKLTGSEVVLRYWATSDGRHIRDWTPDEYIKADPNQVKTMTTTIDDREIEVAAHCVELVNWFVTNKTGRKIGMLADMVVYPKEDNK